MPNKQLTVYHIHTDYKFIWATNEFKGIFFNNKILIIENKIPYPEKNKVIAQYFNNTEKDIKRIVTLCNAADLVVLYDLTPIKIKIALRISKEVKIAWRFFGYELYGKIAESLYSVKTKILLKPTWSEKYIKSVLKIINLKSVLLYCFRNNSKQFQKAIARIDLFFCLSKEEYQFLNKYFSCLPPLIKVSLDTYSNINFEYIEEKDKIVIVGNNRSPYNNHLDIIEIISKNENNSHIEFQLLFNYGPENKYTKAIRKYCNNCKSIKIIESYMPSEEFNSFYKHKSAFVLNGFRQMALTNVVEAIRNGVKIYLNKKNITLYWLRNEGFIIHTIEDFEVDISTNNLQLSESEALHNINNWSKYSLKYSLKEFHNHIIKEIGYSYL